MQGGKFETVESFRNLYAIGSEIGTVQLVEGGALVVRLHGPDGRPVEDRVQVSADPSAGVGRQIARDEDGELRFPSLAPGTWIVRARSVHFACAPVTVEVRAGEESQVELRLEPGTVRGVLLSVPAGAELGFVTARVIDESGVTLLEEQLIDARTGSQPSFGFPGLRIGTYLVEVSSSSGLSGRAELVVDSLEVVPDVATIELR